MSFFVAAGIIADDIVRKETRNGVLAVFRLETGAPNRRRLWIDVEAWGQLAGTVAHHGSAGRGVLVHGRLTYKTWRDSVTGESRHRHVVTALDVDLLREGVEPPLSPSILVVCGRIDTIYPDRPTSRGIVYSFRLASGRTGSKAGRLWIDIEQWRPLESARADLHKGCSTIVRGELDFRSSCEVRQGGLYVRSTDRL